MAPFPEKQQLYGALAPPHPTCAFHRLEDRHRGPGGGGELVEARGYGLLHQKQRHLFSLIVLVGFVAVEQLRLVAPLHQLSSSYYFSTGDEAPWKRDISATTTTTGLSSGVSDPAALALARHEVADDDLGSSGTAAGENDSDSGNHSTITTSFWETPESFRHHTFPRWSTPPLPQREKRGRINNPDPPGEREKEGINLPSLLMLLDDLIHQRERAHQFLENFVYVWGADDDAAAGGGGDVLPSAAALQRGKSSKRGSTPAIWTSERVREHSMWRTHNQVKHRVRWVETALDRAWKLLNARAGADLAAADAARRRWPLLLRILQAGGSNPNGTTADSDHAPSGRHGFPLIFFHGDHPRCNRNNYLKNMSVPVLTTCASVQCTHALPFPNYRTVRDSRSRPSSWDAAFKRQASSQPWSDKTRQVVWRGSLTGEGSLSNPSPRIRLGLFAAAHRDHPLLDIGIRGVPGGRNFSTELLEQLLMKPGIPMGNFSNYRAILDADGNSWSSRFGSLLCTNSVVLKVEPKYVDYFNKYLEPWTHYIPVRSDLSDLMETVEWVLSPANEPRVLQIVKSANGWCRTHMTYQGVALDMLDVLNAYVALLDRDDARWTDAWAVTRARMWDPSSGWKMRRLEDFLDR